MDELDGHGEPPVPRPPRARIEAAVASLWQLEQHGACPRPRLSLVSWPKVMQGVFHVGSRADWIIVRVEHEHFRAYVANGAHRIALAKVRYVVPPRLGIRRRFGGRRRPGKRRQVHQELV